jgi:hypothetical protein
MSDDFETFRSVFKNCDPVDSPLPKYSGPDVILSIAINRDYEPMPLAPQKVAGDELNNPGLAERCAQFDRYLTSTYSRRLRNPTALARFQWSPGKNIQTSITRGEVFHWFITMPQIIHDYRDNY